jgi:PAS domain S-box-containing protein
MFIFGKKQKNKDQKPDPSEQPQDEESIESVSEPEPSVQKQHAQTATEVAASATPKVSREDDQGMFRSFLSGMYDAVLIVDDKGYVLQSNPRACEFFGYDEADLWNINCGELVPQLNTQVLFKIRTHVAERRFTVVNASCKRQDESQFPAEIAISSVVMSGETYMVLSIRNCERRNMAQHRNKIKSEALRAAGAGVIYCTSDGAILYCNPAFLKMVTAENEQAVLRHNLSDFCRKEEQMKLLKESPSHSASWYGTLDITTFRGVDVKVQATSSLAEHHGAQAGSAPNLVVTMTLIPFGNR